MTTSLGHSPGDTVGYEEILCSLVKVAIQKQLTGEAPASLRVDVNQDFMRNLFNVRAMWQVLADVPRQVEYELLEREPASWFQMLKRKFPDWAVRRWPIQTRTHTRVIFVDLQKLYPDAPVPADFGAPIFKYAHHEFEYRRAA